MKLFPIIILVFALVGCDQVPRDITGIKPPPKWSMAKQCRLPSYPDLDGDPVERASYDVKVRNCAASRGRQVVALQQYVRRVAKAD
jgi:hypothetical protein